MNLVIGATGQLGGEIVRLMRAMDMPVRAMVRETSDLAKVDQLRQLGVDLVYGDLKDRLSLDASCEGIKTVISTATAMRTRQAGDSIWSVDRDGHLKLIDAAKGANVKHMTYISLQTHPETECPLTIAKHAIDYRLQTSGLGYTIIRPGYFMESWLNPTTSSKGDNGWLRIYGDGTRPISWVSYKDLPRLIVATLDNPDVHKAILPIAAPEVVSPREIVRMFEGASGEHCEIEQVSVEALQHQLEHANDSIEASYAGLMLMYAAGYQVDPTETLRMFPMQLHPVQQYVHDYAAEHS
ncbi:SDR family oxidoreductase [Chloroflexi bacterium TSY]|nr:SDR family oxidoreductase [Chloroflexi bacterium TSY]